MTSSSTSDVRLAIRSLARSPLFAIVAILSLALGIGANTAIFTLIDQIVLRKLPVQDPEQLRDALPAGVAQRQQHGDEDALVPHVSGLPEEGRAAGRRALPAARPGVGEHRQPDRAARGRAGVGELLYAARREARGGPGLQFAGGRPDLSGPPGRRAQLHLLGQPVRTRSRRGWQEDPRERLPDDDRRGFGRRLRRHRPGALAAGPDPGPDEARDAA